MDLAFAPDPGRVVRLPEGTQDAQIRQLLLKRFNLEIGGGLGDLAGKVWRIGLMGYASNPKNVILCLSALESTLRELGGNIDNGAALDAASKVYAQVS